jgi:acylphosphatase
MIQQRVCISGRVQGVNFRGSAEAKARQVDPELQGWVRNLEDGRVEAVFAGAEKSVSELAEWCRKGSARAQVSHIQILDEPYDKNLPRFEIRR